MAGDNRVRHCSECKLNVYNLSELTKREAEELIAAREGRLCVRFYRRADGTILTQNCPKGLRAVVRRVSRVAGALSAMISLGFAALPVRLQGAVSQPAQGEEGQTGVALKVIDSHHAVVPNAVVVLADMKNKKKIWKKTGSTGLLRLAGLMGGSYKITVVVPGFKIYKNVVILPERQIANVEVKLQSSDEDLRPTGGVVVLAVPDVTPVPPMPDTFRTPQLPSPMRR
jgi:hypothetical protein